MFAVVHRIKSFKSSSGLLVKHFSAAADPEWNTARPYEAIPKQSLLSREFFPGGRLFNASLDDFVAFMLEKHGKLVRIPGVLGRPEMVMTFEPEDYKKIYRTEGVWPGRRNLATMSHYRSNYKQDIFGTFRGLVDEQGEQWQKFRTMLNPVMMQPKTVNLYVADIDAVARDFIKITKKYRDDTNNEVPADYGKYVQRFTLEAIATIALETRLNVLEPGEQNKGAELAKSVDRVFYLSYQLDVLPSIWKYYKTPMFKEMMRELDRTFDICKDYIDEAIARIGRETSSKSEELQSVLEKLLKIDRNVAIVMALDMLAVGIDTTSSSINSLLYLLATNPEKQARLRAEILEILPNKNDPLTPEKMKNLPYLRACMKEQQRVLPVVSGNVRKAGKDVVLQGYRVPKDTDVVMSHAKSSLDEAEFPMAGSFIPERWLRDESQAENVGCPHAKNAHTFTYMPFGFGSRACIGKRFAELETSILVTRMVREFDLSWHYPPPTVTSHILRSITSDLKFRLIDQKS